MQIRHPIDNSFRKELQQKIQTDNCPLRQILDGIDKETDGTVSTKVALKSTLNKFVAIPAPAFNCSKLTTKTIEQGMKYVQS